MAAERLQKLLAQAGYGSRRACEEYIIQGRVTVNGSVATLGQKADPSADDIRLDQARLKLPDSFIYIALNKPRDVISDEDEGGNWARARDLIPFRDHLYPVGRLDVRSEGLLLFTNDGDLAHQLTHPRFEHPKTYQVLVMGSPSETTLEAWRRGVMLDGVRTVPAEVRRLQAGRDSAWLEVTVIEGKKRMLRRVAAQLGHPVVELKRISIGPITLGDLPSGAWRRLTDDEVRVLREIKSRPVVRRQRRSPVLTAKSTPARGSSGLPKNGPRVSRDRKPGRKAKR